MSDTPHSDDSTPEAYLTRLADGREVTSQELANLVYDDLHAMAKALFRRESRALTLQPTALVHEAWLRLADQRVEGGWQNRAHFLGIAARSMRRVLANAARDRGRLKRGGGADRVTLTGNDPETSPRDLDLVDLDAALEALAKVKERYARIVELRYFAGLTIAEVAEVLGVSTTIVEREWAKARAWLALKLESAGEGPPG
jgi:RNA polymerase sigma factor (TIGR02999 family)